jgi:excisionase family DNA binding protein
MSDKLLSISQAAEQLGLSSHTIRAWVQKRQIQHYKLGRRVLISPASLSEFLAKRLIDSESSKTD